MMSMNIMLRLVVTTTSSPAPLRQKWPMVARPAVVEPGFAWGVGCGRACKMGNLQESCITFCSLLTCVPTPVLAVTCANVRAWPDLIFLIVMHTTGPST